MSIYTCSKDQLPSWVYKDELPENGVGSEDASYIVIDIEGYQKIYSDAMEPEDARFSRDLNWIAGELFDMYKRQPSQVIENEKESK